MISPRRALSRALLLGCCARAAPPPQPARPNVLWVMMDDLRALLPPQRLADAQELVFVASAESQLELDLIQEGAGR